MKLNIIHILWAAVLPLAFASCSQDSFDNMQGESLPQGEYPIELVAGGLQMVANPAQSSTRATVDDDWNGVGIAAVQVGSEVKPYGVTLSADGKTAKLSSDAPFWWERTDETKTVTAWHPYSDACPADWKVKADQSTAENYQASDWIKGELKDLAFADRNDPSKNKMTFSHQTAKVVVNLLAGDGITFDADASVKLLNVDGADNGSTITSYRPAADTYTYLALLNGQELSADAPFIQVTTGGGAFLYKPQTSKTLQAGTAYTYDITVKANGIEVTEATDGEWTSGGSEDVSSKDVADSYAASDLKLGDYYYSDGTWSDGGLRKLYSDGTMKWEETTPQPESGKTVIGIVFHVGQDESDESDYSGTGIGEAKCHGYVVALTDATSGYCMWGLFGTELGCYPTDGGGNKLNNYSNPDIDWNGYTWTQKIITAAGGKDNLDAIDQAGYPATYYAVVAYETGCNAPTNSSGWFLPSIGQMWNIYQNRSSLFNGKAVVTSLKSDWYWSSSEYYDYPAYRALYVYVDRGGVYTSGKDYSDSYVRPVLAF